MLINDRSAVARLNSPMNLINRLKNSSNGRKNAMSLFIRPKSEDASVSIKPTFNPFTVPVRSNQEEVLDSSPKIEQLIENSETQVKLNLAHDQALQLLNRSVEMLASKLDDVKADKLPAVISASSKVVEGIRKERNEAAKSGSNKEVHYHFYTPTQKSVSDYEIIDAVGA